MNKRNSEQTTEINRNLTETSSVWVQSGLPRKKYPYTPLTGRAVDLTDRGNFQKHRFREF